MLYQILENSSSSPEALRTKEQAITNLSVLLRQENRVEDLPTLLTQLRPYFSLIPKAKTAKIVREIIDAVSKIPGTSDLQGDGPIKEVRRLDDKLLVDINLLESELHFSLRNLPKAKAALTAARTAANAIYVPPAQQSTIDLQSGILHAEEKVYKTSYSYFFEAFEVFCALEDTRAVFNLKYMLLCKIMAVAGAHAKRSLKLFETALCDFKAQLEDDPLVHGHLSAL
ncbi:hypothetical protein SAY86_013757 [Trapa natans]|uniref:26S proteasome regulatory subunit Rpn6 N-terminal domain-containing protein n=1 Tax=Trapa natans TaxID=22666 RepID=A0AAN7KZS7_TRANT|nr:hypothetical protein SAY86_013757 [Trapa natans]